MSKHATLPILTLFFILSCLFNQTFQTKLSISLIPSKTFCFNEDLPKHTLVKLQTLTNNGQAYRLQIMYFRELLHNMTSSKNIQKSFTTQKFGIHRFCLTNQGQHYNSIQFQFLTGVQAKDFSSHTQNEDYIASINNQAQIAELFINQIKEENKEGLELMHLENIAYNKYSIEYFFTIIFVGVVLLVSYLQYMYVKNYMISRKYM